MHCLWIRSFKIDTLTKSILDIIYLQLFSLPYRALFTLFFAIYAMQNKWFLVELELNSYTLNFWSDWFNFESFVIFELQTQHTGFTVENPNFIFPFNNMCINLTSKKKKKKACLEWAQLKRKKKKIYVAHKRKKSYYCGGRGGVRTLRWIFNHINLYHLFVCLNYKYWSQNEDTPSPFLKFIQRDVKKVLT